MGVAWTEEQKKVIELRGRNILVSAAAGSGKTAVLVERIITMLTDEKDPVSVDELLIVTFTEAAAAEMKERIRAAILKKLDEEPENEHLKTQATLIHNARITTIHSFCLSVVRDHFHVIDLDPGFRTGEEGELKLLRHDVMDELLEEQYEEGSPEFLEFVTAHGTGRTDKKIEELILDIYEFSRSYPDPEGWLKSCVDAYSAQNLEELEESPFVRIVMERSARYLEDAGELLEQGLSLCREEDGPAAYEAALTEDARMVEELSGAEDFGTLSERMQKVSWVRLGQNRDKTVSEEKISQVKAIRDEVKALVGDLASQYFYETAEELLFDLALCRPRMQVLAGLVLRFAELFEAKKREKEMIDFSDMEQYALRILTEREGEEFVPSAVAREYQKQFREIMIDEYQDSNLIQETILTSISTVWEGKYNIFMVGDVKQSIYRFRLSRPELFMEKFDTYSLEDGEKQRIDLHKNFRSRREVLESANYLFRQLMTRSLGGISYDDKAALYAGADYPAYPVSGAEQMKTEVLLIDGDAEELTEREVEARAIAGRIRELIRSHQVVDKETGEYRPCRYSDIVILTRSVKGFVEPFSEVLGREGIPSYTGSKEGYFAAQEIGVLLDYLRVLDNFCQDIPLTAVLRSSFGNLTEEELAVIRSSEKEKTFYSCVSKYREKGEDERIRGKLEACLGQMEKIRECVPYTPMHELLRKILGETGYGDFVSAMPGGEQRRANVEMLVEKAKSFESTSYKGLFHFVRYIEQLRKYNVDYGEASLEDEQSDTVRIMTIHKSKGLEFPVVFVAGMGKRFNMQDARSSVVLHARLGVGLDAVDVETRTKSPSIVKRVIQKEETLDSLGEELRVLYVALTRAKEKLVITGTVSNLEKKLAGCERIRNRQQEELSFSTLSRAVTYWDWILPALVRLNPEVPILVRTLDIEDIVREEVEEETAGRMERSMLERWDTERVYDPGVRDALREQFGYVYPYGESRTQKQKFTVSELKKRAYMAEGAEEPVDAAADMGEVLYEEEEIIPLIPKFLAEEEGVSGASRGTAYHRILELLDFTEEYTEDKLEQAIAEYVKQGKIAGDMAEYVRPGDICAFLKSSAGKRMHESAVLGKLWKEQPFVLGIDAEEIYPGEQGELLLIQGIIDVYFEEEDGLVLLDYKTDRVTRASQLVEKYHAQLDYYAEALEQLTEKKVKEKIIYSFALREEIRLP